MSIRYRLVTSLGASPRHHGSIRGKPTFQNLIPTDDGFPMVVDELLHPFDKVALKFLNVSKTLSLHLGLADRTLCPVALSSLIPTDVDILRRKHLKDFREDILKKLIDLLIARAKLMNTLQMVFPIRIHT